MWCSGRSFWNLAWHPISCEGPPKGWMQRGTGPEFPPPRKRQAGVIFADAPGEPRAVWAAPRARRSMYSPDGQAAERTIPFEWPPTHRKHALDDYPPPSSVHITTRKAGILLSMISPGDPGRGQAQAADKIRQIAFAVSQLHFRLTASGISLEFRICPRCLANLPSRVKGSHFLQSLPGEFASVYRRQIARQPSQQFLAVARAGLAALFIFYDSSSNLPVSGTKHSIGGRNMLIF